MPVHRAAEGLCVVSAALLLLYYCFTTALLLLYYCFTTALLLLYSCFTADLLLLCNCILYCSYCSTTAYAPGGRRTQWSQPSPPYPHTSAYVSIRRHTSAYASIRQHTHLAAEELSGLSHLLRIRHDDMRRLLLHLRQHCSQRRRPPT